MFAIFGLGPAEFVVLGVMCMGVTAGLVVLIVVLNAQSNRDTEHGTTRARHDVRLGVPTDTGSGLVRIVESDPDLAAVVEAWPRLPGHVRSAIRALVHGKSVAPITPEEVPAPAAPPSVETGIRPSTAAPDQPLGGSEEIR
jgi:hypothetical protein